MPRASAATRAGHEDASAGLLSGRCDRSPFVMTGSVWEQVSSGTLVSMPGAPNPLAWKVTMSSWFISPWEAVRLSLEAQRLMAVQFFPFGPPRGQTHQEEATRDIKVVVPSLGSSADLPMPPLSRETVRARTVAARSATDVTRKATATRKLKSNKRKTKNNKQRG